MPMTRRALCWLASAATALAAFGCIPGMFKPRRNVAGGYCLEEWQDTNGPIYFLVACSGKATLRGKTDNGILDGDILRIGTDGTFIVVKRAPIIGDPDWMIVDTNRQVIRGPYSDQAFGTLLGTAPDLKRIVVRDVKEAWRTF